MVPGVRACWCHSNTRHLGHSHDLRQRLESIPDLVAKFGMFDKPGPGKKKPSPSGAQRSALNGMIVVLIQGLRKINLTPPLSFLSIPGPKPDSIVFEYTKTIEMREEIMEQRTRTKIVYKERCDWGVCVMIPVATQEKYYVKVGERVEKRTITEGAVITRNGKMYTFVGEVHAPGGGQAGASSSSIRAGWLIPRDGHDPTDAEVEGFTGGMSIGEAESNRGVTVSRVASSPRFDAWGMEVGWTSDRSPSVSMSYSVSMKLADSSYVDPW